MKLVKISLDRKDSFKQQFQELLHEQLLKTPVETNFELISLIEPIFSSLMQREALILTLTECSTCGKIFMPTTKRAKFCDHTCRSTASMRRHRALKLARKVK